MPYVGQTITEVFPTSISVDSATVSGAFTSQGIDDNADATAITIDSSERATFNSNVSVGNSSFPSKFTVSHAGTDNVIETANTTNSVRGGFQADTSIVGFGSTTQHPLVFRTNNAERARILAPSTSHSGYFKVTDDGTYRDSTGTFHEYRSSNSGNPNIAAQSHHASYAGGIIHLIATRASSGGNYTFIDCYSNNAADREFRVDSDGTVHADGAYSSSGGDYAEMFEWKDGNTSSEDRVGKTVVLDGNQIRLSTSDDAQATIIGVVSATPVILGDAQDEKWIGKYETDSYGRYVFEDYTQTEWTIEADQGDKETKSYQTDMIPSDVTVPDDAIVTSKDKNGNKLTRRKLNSTFDESNTYVSRLKRKEFSAVGLVGKLRVNVGQTIGDRWIKMREISDTVHEYLVR